MSEEPAPDELREEYDFTPQQLREGARGKYAARYVEGVNIVRLDPDVAAMFPDSDAVNRALRALAETIRDRERRSASTWPVQRRREAPERGAGGDTARAHTA